MGLGEVRQTEIHKRIQIEDEQGQTQPQKRTRKEQGVHVWCEQGSRNHDEYASSGDEQPCIRADEKNVDVQLIRLCAAIEEIDTNFRFAHYTNAGLCFDFFLSVKDFPAGSFPDLSITVVAQLEEYRPNTRTAI